MNDSKFRSWLEAEWVRIDDAAAARKNLHGAIVGLSNLYRSLSANERQVADEVVIGWAESDDLKKRFDGLVLIDKFAITAAIPRLQQAGGEPQRLHGTDRGVRLPQSQRGHRPPVTAAAGR